MTRGDRRAGDNPGDVVETERPPSLGAVVLGQLRETMIVVLLVAAVLTVVVGDLSDTAVILLVVAVNTAVGVAQERRALGAVDALRALAAPTARAAVRPRDAGHRGRHPLRPPAGVAGPAAHEPHARAGGGRQRGARRGRALPAAAGRLLSTEPLTAAQLGVVLAASAVPAVVAQLLVLLPFPHRS